MARSGQRGTQTLRCRVCRLQRLPEEEFTRGLCPSCLESDRRRKRGARGAKLLEKAKNSGTVERDGKTFNLIILPPKQRSGRKTR